MIAMGGTVGLAEWIIDDTCLVLYSSFSSNARASDVTAQNRIINYPLTECETENKSKKNFPILSFSIPPRSGFQV